MDFGELSSHRAVSGRTRPGPKPLRARPRSPLPTGRVPSQHCRESLARPDLLPTGRLRGEDRAPVAVGPDPRSAGGFAVPLRLSRSSYPMVPRPTARTRGVTGSVSSAGIRPGTLPPVPATGAHPGIPSPVVRPASRPWPWSWAYRAFPAVRPAEDEFAAGPSEPAFAATFREISEDECAGGGRDLRVRRPCAPSCRSRPPGHRLRARRA